jgi:hypothetical protein
MIKYIIILLSVLALQAHATTSILAQGARNVKTGLENGVSYGGVTAYGDGTHDDTQAFLDAFNKGGLGNRAIYVPPGTYLIDTTLIVWSNMFFFGEPSSPPTLVLKSGSMTSGSAPFICPLAAYNHSAYDTNWNSAGTGSYASANNTFLCDIHDINFTVQSGNSGCFTAMLFEVAQQSSFRNSTLTVTSSQTDALHTGLFAGGNAFVNITMTGNANAWNSDGSGELFFRNCTFDGAANASNVNALTFVDCTFDDPSGTGLTWNGQVLGIYDSTFTGSTPFSPAGNPNTYHYENTSFNGTVAQATSGTDGVYYNGSSESNTSSNLKQTGVSRGSAYPNPSFVYPTSACVNVKSSPYNAAGDGSTNDTTAINSAIAASSEVYFPPGIYNVAGNTITVPAGEHLYGLGSGNSTIYGTGSPIVSLEGAGSGNGVVMENLWIQRDITSGGGGHLMDMNCDPSSLLLDVFLDYNNGSSTMSSLVNIQTGGAFIENAWWTGNPVTTGGVNITTSTGPVTIYDIQPEHWFGPSIVCNGTNNVTILNMETEYGGSFTGSAIVTINNSSSINLNQLLLSGGSVIPIGIKSTSSQLNSWNLYMDTNSSGLVKDGSTSYATSSPASLDAYVRFSGIPSTPGTLTTIKFQTPGAPGTLSTTKQ